MEKGELMFAAGLYSLPEIISGILDTDMQTMEKMLDEAGCVAQVLKRPDVQKKYGLTPTMVNKLDLAMVLGDRVKIVDDKRNKIDEAKAAAMLMTHLRNLDHEEFWAIFVGPDFKLLGVEQISRGGFSETPGAIEVIARQAILKGAFGVYVVHNHPDGETMPSGPDIGCSNHLMKFLRFMGIDLLDSIIIGNTTWTSLKNKKLLECELNLQDLMSQLIGG